MLRNESVKKIPTRNFLVNRKIESKTTRNLCLTLYMYVWSIRFQALKFVKTSYEQEIYYPLNASLTRYGTLRDVRNRKQYVSRRFFGAWLFSLIFSRFLKFKKTWAIKG